MISEKDFPKGWEKYRIKDIAIVDSGQGAPQGDEWYNGDRIFVKAGDLNNLTESKYVGDFCHNISDKAINKYKLKVYSVNSIVFPKSGMSVKTDNIALLKYDSFVVNHLAIIKIIKKDKCIPKYIYYLLKRVKISNLSLNDAYPSIRLLDIKKFKIVLPPIEVQKKIVSILEKAEQLKEHRKEADKLTDDYLKSKFLKMDGNPITNPKKWNIFKFGKVGSLGRGKSKNRPRNAPELLGGPYPLIQTGDIANASMYIKKYTQTYSEIGLKQSKMWPAGTLCITIAANIGNAAILTFDSCFPDSVVGFIPNEKVRTEYVLLWMSFLQKILEELAPEVAQKNINLKILKELDIPVPPIELQNKFAKIVEKIEKMKEHQKSSKEQIEDLFNNLMQKAFKGELVC